MIATVTLLRCNNYLHNCLLPASSAIHSYLERTSGKRVLMPQRCSHVAKPHTLFTCFTATSATRLFKWSGYGYTMQMHMLHLLLSLSLSLSFGSFPFFLSLSMSPLTPGPQPTLTAEGCQTILAMKHQPPSPLPRRKALKYPSSMSNIGNFVWRSEPCTKQKICSRKSAPVRLEN